MYISALSVSVSHHKHRQTEKVLLSKVLESRLYNSTSNNNDLPSLSKEIAMAL